MRTWLFWILPALLFVTATMTAVASNPLAKGDAASSRVDPGETSKPGDETIQPGETPCPACGG
jgi:hypothetical protein